MIIHIYGISFVNQSILFPNGINLIILDITSYDLTDNVKVICPKQNYSNEFIDDSKKNVFFNERTIF